MIPIDSTTPADMTLLGVAFVAEPAHVPSAAPLALVGVPHGVDIASVTRDGNNFTFPAAGYYTLQLDARRFKVGVFPVEALAAPTLARRAHSNAPRTRLDVEAILTAIARSNEPLEQLTPERPVPDVRLHRFGGDFQ
jgi:hypothetical protein